jgi:hypothetical protein
MATRASLEVIEGNAETIDVVITAENGGAATDLTGLTVEYLIKETPETPDTEALILSTATGAITITDAAAGKCRVALPAQSAGQRWRRLDVVSGPDRRTAIYGWLTVVDV